MTDHDVKDLSLADSGKLKIEWAEHLVIDQISGSP